MKRTAAEREQFVAARADQMRAFPTGAEARAWEILEPLGFERQCVVTGWTKNGLHWHYILDFGRLRHFVLTGDVSGGLAVEIDGSSHRRKKGRDRRRDTRLAGEGIRTIRVSNNEVLRHPDKFRERVMEAMK